MQIAIIGGGIGGLALALSLHDAGLWDVDVYESAPAIRELGVGINLLPHAVRELTELGLLEALAAVGIPTAEYFRAGTLPLTEMMPELLGHLEFHAKQLPV